MYIKLLQYQNFIYFFILLFSFSFSVFFVMCYVPFASDESKTPKYIFPQVEERTILRIFFYLFLSVRKRENFPIFSLNRRRKMKVSFSHPFSITLSEQKYRMD